MSTALSTCSKLSSPGRVQQRELLDLLVRGQQVALDAVGEELQRALAFLAAAATRCPCCASRCAIHCGSACRSTGSTWIGDAVAVERGEPGAVLVMASSRGSSTSVSVLSLPCALCGELLQRRAAFLARLARRDADLDDLLVGEQAQRAAGGQHLAPVEVRAGDGVHGALGVALARAPRRGSRRPLPGQQRLVAVQRVEGLEALLQVLAQLGGGELHGSSVLALRA